MQPLLTLTYNDPLGYLDIGDALFSVAAANGQSCYMKYNVQASMFYLVNNNFSQWQPLSPGSGGVVSNDKCVLHGSGSTASGSGTTLTVNFALDFNVPNIPLLGQNSASLYVSNSAGGAGSGWQQKGTWNVALVPDVPTLVSETSNASNDRGLFAFTARSYGGNANLNNIDMLFSDFELDAYGACYLMYVRSANALYLTDDKASYWQGGFAPLSYNLITNGQCTVDLSKTTVTFGYDTVTITPYIIFNPTYVGTQHLYMYANDLEGQVSSGNVGSGWGLMGTWPGLPAQPQWPTVSVSLPPSPSGTGTNGVFTFHTSDVNGYKYIPKEQILIASTVTGYGTCSLLYTRVLDMLYLQSDDGATWVDSGTLGSQKKIRNSQCEIDLAGSTSSGSNGNDLNVQLAISNFYPSFFGTRYLWMYPTDRTGSLSWSNVGTWNVDLSPPLVITTNSLPTGTMGSQYSALIDVTGGTLPYRWSVSAQPFPLGIAPTGSPTTALFGGMALSSFNASISVAVTDNSSPVKTTSKNFTLTIGSPGSLTIVSPALPNGLVGSFYSQTLLAAGGTPNYTWSSSPTPVGGGLALSSTGWLSGFASAGTYQFTATVRDGAGHIANTPFSVTITSASVAAKMITPAPGGLITGNSATFSWDAGVGVSQYRIRTANPG